MGKLGGPMGRREVVLGLSLIVENVQFLSRVDLTIQPLTLTTSLLNLTVSSPGLLPSPSMNPADAATFRPFQTATEQTFFSLPAHPRLPTSNPS